MSQHDFNIANQTFPSFRSDLNDALQASATMSAGSSAPTTPYAYQLWFDTTTDTWKVRNSGNTAWISTITTDLATGNVGIGNSSPIDKLHLGTNSGGTQLKIQSGLSANNCILHTNGTTDSWRTGMNLVSTNGSYEFYDDINNVGRMVITSAGLVGIGESSPSFDVGNTGIHIGGATSPAIRLKSSTTGSGDWEIYADSASTGGLGFYEHQNNATFMYLSEGGNLGIGTSSPAYNLDVYNPASTGAPLLAQFKSAGGDTQLYVDNSTITTQLTADNANSAGIVGTKTNHPFVLRTNNAEAMRINSSGSVGIGTSSPDAPLDVRKDNPSSGRVATFGSNGTPFTGEAAGLANAVTISRTLRTIAASTTTTLVNGYGGSIVLITLTPDTGVDDIQYTFLVTHAWSSASVLFSNTYGANTATFTFSASTGNLQVNHNHTGAIKFNVAALVVPSPTTG